jgi:hypothetical protein
VAQAVCTALLMKTMIGYTVHAFTARAANAAAATPNDVAENDTWKLVMPTFDVAVGWGGLWTLRGTRRWS